MCHESLQQDGDVKEETYTEAESFDKASLKIGSIGLNLLDSKGVDVFGDDSILQLAENILLKRNDEEIVDFLGLEKNNLVSRTAEKKKGRATEQTNHIGIDHEGSSNIAAI